MTFSELATRFVVGGTMVVVVNLIGKSRNSFVAGLAVLFPAVTLSGYYFLSMTQHGSLSKTVLFSVWSLPTSLTFLLALYFTIDRIPIFQSLALGVVAWFLTALIVFRIYTFFTR